MMEMVEANWLLIVIALLIGLAIAWYVFHVKRTTRVTGERRDVLDEGADRAGRNQALIDTPPSAVKDERRSDPRPHEPETGVAPVTAPTGLAGAGPAVAGAATQAEAETRETTDEERVQKTADPTPAPAASAPPPPTPTPTTDGATSPSPKPTVAEDTNELTRIKGVGPKLAIRLQELGVTQLSQIAAWTDDDIERIDPQLGRFEGRIRRDDWVTQARLLTEGDLSAYEAKFGRT